MNGKNKEVEFQFPDFDKKKIIKAIKLNGGELVHPRMLYRAIYYFSPNKDILYRIRQENDGITLTKKVMLQFPPDEYEIKISEGSDFETIHHFLISLIPDFQKYKKIETEKIREKWSLKPCHEIVFDIWPGLDEYMEVDCAQESHLKKVIKKLGLSMETKYYTTGHNQYYHERYGIDKKTLLDNMKFIFSDFSKSIQDLIKGKTQEEILEMKKLLRKKQKEQKEYATKIPK
jgi:hypothetical protein